MENSQISQLLVEWYQSNKRDLLWRRTSDPYSIWLSEVLLQQTRVAQAIPYYKKFLETFPTVDALANASEEEVLRLWQGLGYYSRGRNLSLAAKQVVVDFNGIFPDNYKDLLKLKGVGSYTAAAVASIAFNEAVAVLDGNVFRVLSRIFGISTDISSREGKIEFASLANKILPNDNFSIHNQAIMEFGALHCTPVNPRCNSCPLQNLCVANTKGIQHLLPVKLKAAKKKNRFFHYFIFRKDDKFLLKRRAKKDIWQGLYEFLLIEQEGFYNKQQIFDQEGMEMLKALQTQELQIPKHILTHQHIFSKAFYLEITDLTVWEWLIKKYTLSSCSFDEVEAMPKPVLISKYLNLIAF